MYRYSDLVTLMPLLLTFSVLFCCILFVAILFCTAVFLLPFPDDVFTSCSSHILYCHILLSTVFKTCHPFSTYGCWSCVIYLIVSFSYDVLLLLCCQLNLCRLPSPALSFSSCVCYLFRYPLPLASFFGTVLLIIKQVLFVLSYERCLELLYAD